MSSPSNENYHEQYRDRLRGIIADTDRQIGELALTQAGHFQTMISDPGLFKGITSSLLGAGNGPAIIGERLLIVTFLSGMPNYDDQQEANCATWALLSAVGPDDRIDRVCAWRHNDNPDVVHGVNDLSDPHAVVIFGMVDELRSAKESGQLSRLDPELGVIVV